MNLFLFFFLQTFERSRKKFIQALLDNLAARFPDDRLLKAAAVLDIMNWPQNDDERVLFGDIEVAFLSMTLNVPVSDLHSKLCNFLSYRFEELYIWLEF